MDRFTRHNERKSLRLEPDLEGGYKNWCKNQTDNYKDGEDCVELTAMDV